MDRMVRATRRELFPCPCERAVEAVRNIQGIEDTEVKADRVEVFPTSATEGTYAVVGRFAGMRWRSRFAYRLHESGFHSHKVAGEVPNGWEISGGFAVADVDGTSCLVVHYEDYGLPWYLVPFKPLVAGYLRWSMRVELAALREMVLAGGVAPGRRAPDLG
jgi:hypothetical protein